MEDKSLPQPVGGGLLPPPSLTPEQEDICKRIDQLYMRYNLKVKASDMFKGAIFAARIECRSNPDWVAQAANSLREILYPFWSPSVDTVTDKKTNAFKKYGSVRVDENSIQDIGRVYGLLSNLAHHGSTSAKFDFTTFTITDFEKLLLDFERVIRDALMRQIDIHQEIDKILISDPSKIEVTEDTNPWKIKLNNN
ncbi:hypothetical protein ES707_07230 [subsurface metagenome]